MEPLPLATPVPHNNNSKKRLTAASCMDAEVVEVSPTTPGSSKSQKIEEEVLYDEVIDVDSDDDSTDVAVIATKEVNKAMKGKAIINVSDGDLNGLAEVVEEKPHISSILDDDDLYYYDDDDVDDAEDEDDGDYMDYLEDDMGDFGGYDQLQAHFDDMDVPPGVEASVPWLSDPSKSEIKSEEGTSSKHASIPTIKDKNGRIITVVDQENVHIVDTMLRYEHFKIFDTVEDYSDHHYNTSHLSVKKPPKEWAKRIQEEWKILEKDLPDTIFVRVYEERMDLLRAVIVGAQGTPYHDGLFFFDVLFPSTYPDTPPQVYYQSRGLRLNPNLYKNGYVCLSLLNTWDGNKDQKWQPKLSTMLQVLVSIQGLVLNADPYFNEPEYERSRRTEHGKKRSLKYSENTFILSLKTMSYTMRKPPKYFEELVAGHFMTHAQDILETCRAYLQGAEVGTVVKGGRVQDQDDAAAAGGHNKNSSSDNFKKTLFSYLPFLGKDFTDLGLKGVDKFLPPLPAPASASLLNMTP